MPDKIYRREECVLSTAYIPPVSYFAAIATSSVSFIEACECYQKQSFRNRCVIYSANGPLSLNVPVKRGGADFTHKLPIREIEIDYSEAWIPVHEKALVSAYEKSPFFEFYRDEIFGVLERKEKYLFDLNFLLLNTLLKFAGIRADIRLTDRFIKSYESGDFRSRIHPKSKEISLLKEMKKEKPYWQVFSSKQGFIPDLSVIDLLSSEGPNAISFLS